MNAHAQSVVCYVEARPGHWRRHSFSFGSRLNGTPGDVRLWPPDEYTPVRVLALDYNPDAYSPPATLDHIPTACEIAP